MKERPILFSAPMVRAILAGQKTQTRRVVKLAEFGHSDTPGYDWTFRDSSSRLHDYRTDRIAERCPYGVTGDCLYGREKWAYVADDWDGHIEYAATCERRGIKWRSPIHMPRIFSRITLEITGVRVERLQEIREADARAEGIKEFSDGRYHTFNPHHASGSAVNCFAVLWESINGPGSWGANPWVWVLDLKRVEVAP